MDRRGTFAVALHAIRWRGADDQQQQTGQQRSVWASVTLDCAALEGVWFAADDDNASTTSVELTRDGDEGPLEYTQSSRPLALSSESLTALLNAQLRVAVYYGSTRSRTSDQLWGEASVSFLPALLSERLHDTVRIIAETEEVSVELSVQCDADLTDVVLGARVLRVHSLAIVRPPSEWTLPSANDEEAVRLCSAPDRNTAAYELELELPDFRGDGGAERTSDVVRFSGGKLQYTPDPNADREAEGGDGGLTGEWSITFPSGMANKLYLKSAISRLLDYLQVEKTTTALLRRSNVDAAGRVTASVSLNLHSLASPGQTRVDLEAPLRKILPLPKEALEQELAAAASNDEKKRLQALIIEYDAAIAQAATTLSTSVRAAKTRVAGVVEIVGSGPLVLEPPTTLAPTKTIDELIPPRDLSDEYDQRKDVVADLRTEIRRVVLTVLREYEDADFHTDAASASRDDKRQRIVFKLNSQGAYHAFKEKLKKRIVPVIRDQFGDDVAVASDEQGATHDEEPLDGKTPTDARKKTFFASVYATLMDEVQRVLHEAFFASSSSMQTLEKTHGDLQPRDDANVTQKLTTLGLRALENEVNGDAEKSEALHLDRIAFAEERAIEMPHAAASMRPSLATVWFEYATFCLGQQELDKAGGALRQSLSLEPHSIDTLVAYGALLCELKDFTAADVVVKNVVANALEQVANSSSSSSYARVLAQLTTAHALLALYFSESRTDETGNLVLFELLKAQRVLRQLQQTSEPSCSTEPCLSSVWIHLAAALHALRLRGVTQTALQLADQSRRPRDVLSRDERVLKRVVLAEVLSLRGDGDRATALLEDALEIDHHHAFAWLVLGKTFLQLESQTPRAVECLQRSLEYRHQLRSDQRLSLVVHLGLVLLQTSQFAAAKATFLGACDEFPLASTWLGVGIASLRLEQWDAAQVALAEASRLDACNPDVWGYLALLALSASPRVAPQHERRATHSVAQAMRFQLSNPVLLRELSSGFVAIDRLEQAERLLRRALVFQDSSLTRKTLADVLAAQNCAEAALAQYQQSLDESRDLAQRKELLDKCAALLGTLGRPAEAAECRQMAAELLQPPEAPVGKVSDGGDAGRDSPGSLETDRG